MKALRKLISPAEGRQSCIATFAAAARGGAPENCAGLIVIQALQQESIYSSLGYSAGSEVLAHLRSAARGAIGTNDVLIKLDDSRLAIVLGSLRHANHALLAANRVRNACEQNLVIADHELALRLVVGVAVAPAEGETAESTLRRAETALRDAQESGQAVVMDSEPTLEPTLREWEIEENLTSALEQGDLQLFYQPKIDVRSGHIAGVEGLLRWQGQNLTPDVFIPVAERSGQIADLTRFSLLSAARQASEWPESLGNINVAVNLSAMLLQSSDLPSVIDSALAVWGIVPHRLTLEVTETALMEDPVHAHTVLSAIRELGCRVSIDDFGTGYSSLSYFKNIPADELKIDKSFVFSMLDDSRDRKIVSHIISLAHSFDLQVVAEGVETEAVLTVLRELDCDYAQGFYFSKALSADDFVTWADAFRIS